MSRKHRTPLAPGRQRKAPRPEEYLEVEDEEVPLPPRQLEEALDIEAAAVAPAIAAVQANPLLYLHSQRMPYGRKRKYSKRSSYRGGMRLDAGARAVAAAYSREVRREKRIAAANAFAATAGAMAARVKDNVDMGRTLALAQGRGSYKLGNLGRDYTRWAKSGTGRMVRGMGADLLHKFTGIGLDGRGMYSGRGAYTNSLIDDNMGVADEVPLFAGSTNETGMVTVSRKEYICDIYGPSTPAGNSKPFGLVAFELNPGLERTFPWLSQIAMNYGEYDFKQLIFTYRSTTTDIGSSTNGQCGTVIMATNYNPSEQEFEDKNVMMEYDAAMSCKVTETMMHGVECDPSKLSGSEGKYVRNNPVIPNQDLKTLDHGLFQLAIANAPDTYANESLGELWVTYTVELRKPKFYSGRGLGISQDLYVSGGDESLTALMGSSTTLLSGQQNNINCLIGLPTNAITITFPAYYAGFVEIRLVCEGITTTAGSVSPSTVGNIQYVPDMYAGHGGTGDSPRAEQKNSASAIGAGNTNLFFILHVQVQLATGGVDNVLTLVTGNVSTAPTQSQLLIQEYNSGFSYRALNVGGAGAASQSQAPILINSNGVIVTP